MEELCQVIIRLFRYVQPQDIISGAVRFDRIETELLKKLYYISEQQSDESDNERRIQWVQDQALLALHDKRNQSMKGSQLTIFDLIELMNEELLVCENDEVLCRFEKLQQWRNITIQVDSNLFVAAKYAITDCMDGQIRRSFSWKNVIGNNNLRLNRILQGGISENHFHLMGSVYYFDLAWISLMNLMNQKEIVQKLDQMENARRGIAVQNKSGTILGYAQLHLMAALIRAYLYAELTGQMILISGSNLSTDEVANGSLCKEEAERNLRRQIEKILKNPQSSLWSRELQILIESLRERGTETCKDYAMNVSGGWYDTDEQNAIMRGEKWFLYQMFYQRRSRRSPLTTYHFQLFYAYLVIKEQFRMELLQCNERYGFVNFSQYQRRKGWFTTAFSAAELARTAVNSVFDGQNVLSLEVRVKPGNTLYENVRLIQFYDQAILKDSVQANWITEQKFYYVFHFAKKKDDGKKRFGQFNHMFCRHAKFRMEIRQQSEAILQMREKNPKVASRLKGIDACSNEDGCRPEVFATAFRVLKRHSCYQKTKLEMQLPQLRLTYHVGEVFQDILDGLRAIDEAVFFLNLDCGDRMGHATVLGMDPREWYQDNQYIINIRKQDYLDNVAWLYRKLIEYRYRDDNNLIPYLEKEFHKIFADIYEKALEKNYIESVIRAACQYDSLYGNMPVNGSLPFEYNITTYYDSWRLRGDDPELYLMGYYRRNNREIDIWKRYGVNEGENLRKIRYSLSAVILNHFYHYNMGVKDLGSVSTQVRIPEHMVDAICFVQQQMQRKIAKKGIAIETNPTSNVLINRIKKYAQHPIIRLYNKGLLHDPQSLSQCAQMNVSINTDDQGVFSTSLSNEYALMASSLGSVKDAEGNFLYNMSDIYDWIEQVQTMGNRQSFNFEDREISGSEDQENGRLARVGNDW